MSLLHDEIQKPQYAGMNDDVLAKTINAVTVALVTTTVLSIAAVVKSLGFNQAVKVLAVLRDSPSDGSKYVYAMIVAGQFDVGVQAMRDGLDACVPDIGQTNCDTLKGLGVSQVPLYQTLGFNRPLDYGDVKLARQANG